MAISIVRINENFEIIKFYGHIFDDEIDHIRRVAQQYDLKCLKYIDSYESTFFNQKQIYVLSHELENPELQTLKNALAVIHQAIVEEQNTKNFLAFWGD